jgi:hypothetical protein
MEPTIQTTQPSVGTPRRNTMTSFGFILGISLIISTVIAGGMLHQIRALDSTLSVTGSAKKRVTSDSVKWTSSMTRIVKASGIKAGYDQMNKDLESVKTFFTEQGIAIDQVTISPIMMNQNYDYQAQPGVEKEYTLMQTFDITSGDVQKITQVAKNTQAIINKGVIFSTGSLEYYYTKLPEERVALLAQAITDAKARASTIAQSGGKSIGSLKSASSGVVQVVSFGSNDVSDYGMYDTSRIEKEIMVTVKAAFTLK